jgi:shikimate dehydrogenase
MPPAARAMGWLGFNCSIPHKVAIIAHIDGLGESAATIGAVNCVVRRGDRLIGENTDGAGFMESLRALAGPRGKSIVVFGAGGAARAVAVELALAGAAKLTIVNRGEARGRELAALINEKTKARAEFALWDRTHAIDPGADILVNATSIGMFPNVEARLDIDASTLLPSMIAADVVVNPPRTPFLREAEARGLRAIDGLGMLVNQGAVSIRHWFGIDVEASVMRRKVAELFGV